MRTVATALLASAWAVPAALVLCWTVPGLRRWGVRAVPWAAAPALLLALAAGAAGPSSLRAEMPLVFTGLHLELDAVGGAFLLLTSLLWLAAGVFAGSYHRRDPDRERFFLFFALTMTGNLGLVVAGDLLSFYLFFALMTFAAYGLVVHRGDGEARRAGRVYIVLAILGELAILTGLFSLGAASGGVPLFGPEVEGAWRLLEQGHRPGLPASLTALLLVAGFGVKAGVVPLHVWLPLAHPVAPTAASALLSGAMIKGGLLAWVRLLPEGAALPGVGLLLMAVGATTALWGVVAGLAQDDAKTVLAYSSVSQMGYMALAVGLLLQGPEVAGIAVTGIALYALHHGVAKGALFLAVGVVDRAPRRARWPAWTVGVAALPALALAGLPLTTGALAKNMLKAGMSAWGGPPYPLLDPFLLLAAFGTALLMARYLVLLAGRLAARDAGPAAASSIRGLVAPFSALVIVGAAGVYWLPRAVPAPAQMELPGLLEGAATGTLPIALGAAVAWWVRRRSVLASSLTRFRIPAGDALVPVERLVERIPRLDQEKLRRRLESLAERGERIRDPVFRIFQDLADRDLRSMRGPILGSALLGLALLLVLALA